MYDLKRLTAEAKKLWTDVSADEQALERLPERRLRLGNKLIEIRACFTKRGDGFVAHVETKVGIAMRTAQDYMRLAGYVTEHQVGATVAPIPTYREAGITRAPSKSPVLGANPAYRPTDAEREITAQLEMPVQRSPQEQKDRYIIACLGDAINALKTMTGGGYHLDQVSKEHFQRARGLLYDIAGISLKELEGAGALAEESAPKRRLELLIGGRQ